MQNIGQRDDTGGAAAGMLSDMALAAKYACQGPRYTSYPTAPQFNQADAVGDYLRQARDDSTANAAPLSLYVHLPFCRDICYYCACNKIITRENGAAQRYLDHLEREVEQQSQLIGRHRPISQLHWGGGTPTFLDAAELTRLMHMLASHFHLQDRSDREYAVEIDPRTVTAETIALLRGLGFNRLSMGIQDFDPLVQKAINRIQPYAQVETLVNSVRRHSYDSLSFDLIYGLPHQDRHSMTETLQRVIALAPDRIACYSYAHLPGRFSSQRAIDRLSIPAADEKLLLHQLISDTLAAAGYIHIGMDHFVLPDDELAQAQGEGRLQRNFQGYSLRLARDILGLGMSAISQIGDYYLQNERELAPYYERIARGELPLLRGCRVSAEDKLRRHVIMGLICDLQLDTAACGRSFGIDFASHFAAELQGLSAMAGDGLIAIGDGYLRVTERGRPFLRNMCMLFDAYLTAPGPEAAAGATIFSTTL